MTAVIVIDIIGLDRARRAVRPLSRAFYGDLLEAVTSAVVLQTSIRIAEEKTDPSGAAWAPWSASYAATRPSGSGLLVDTGRLLGSISSMVVGMTGFVGTNVPYGGYINDGTRKMPARRYLGLSKANSKEIETMIEAMIERYYR